SFINDGKDFLHRHLVLIDQLDAVDARFGELAHLRASVLRSVGAPSKVFGSRIRFVLNKGPGNIKRRSRDLPRVYSISNRDAFLERCAQVPSAGDAGHEQLLRRSRHDDRFHERRISLVPVGIVAMAVDHQMNVHVPETWKHGHAFSGDNFCALRYGKHANLAYSLYSFAFNDDNAVAKGLAAEDA